MYLQVCRQLGLVPVSYYLRHIDDEQLVLRHHSIDAAAAQAIAAPLAVCIDRLVTSPPPPPPRDSRRGIAFGRVGLFVCSHDDGKTVKGLHDIARCWRYPPEIIPPRENLKTGTNPYS